MLIERKPIVVDNVSYGGFQDLSFVEKLPDLAAGSYVIFLRKIGVCQLKDLANLFGETSTEATKRLVTRLRLIEDVDKISCLENVECTKKWQHEILGEDPRKYYVPVNTLLNRVVHDTMYSNPYGLGVFEKNVEDYLRKQQNSKNNPKEAPKMKSMEETIGKPISQMGLVDVLPAAKACMLKPLRDAEEAKRNENYFQNLLVYFPHLSSGDVAKYLFQNKYSTWSVRNWLSRDAAEPRGRGAARHSRATLYERAAFVAWAGGDYETYIQDELDSYSKTAVRMRTQATERKQAADAAPAGEVTAEEVPQDALPAGEVVAEEVSRDAAPAKRSGKKLMTVELWGKGPDILRALADLMEKYDIEVDQFC